MNTLIYIAIFIIQLGVKAFGDWWYKKYQKKIINHKLSSGIDIFIYIIAGYFFIIVPQGWTTVPFAIGVLIVTLSARWILYDLLYNLINKHKWDHYGDSSLIDKLMKKLGKWHIVVKLIMLGIGINLIVWF